MTGLDCISVDDVTRTVNYFTYAAETVVCAIFRAKDAKLLLKTIPPVTVGVHDSVSVLFDVYNGQLP